MQSSFSGIRLFRVRLLIAFIVGAMSFCSAHAQTITADVNGTVTDSAGAVIPNATVTATNVDTGVAVPTTTNAAGVYSIRFLQIGNYKITADAKGFETTSVGPFALESGQIAKIDAKLTIGTASTTVDVSGNFAPLINTQNGTVDTVIDSNMISNLPLAGNNYSSLTLFLPGSVTTTPTSIDTPGTGDSITRSTNGQDFSSINGGRLQQNDYLLDGVETDETINNAPSYNPYPDALEEVRVISANAPAEFGNVNGGDILSITKSGTNTIHGSASFNLQDYQLDANTWANKHFNSPSQDIAKTPYTQSIFGGTLGGPIIKDKLFAFGDYEGTRYHTGGPAYYNVLSPLMAQGNFSELLDPNLMCSSYQSACAPSYLTQLYDPQTNSPGYGYGAPFYNNVICGATTVPTGFATSATTPCSAENPVYNYIVNNPSIYPVANQAPATVNSANGDNYKSFTSTNEYNNQYDIKVDWTPKKKDRVSVRWTQGKAFSGSTNPIPTSFPTVTYFPIKGTAINWVHTFSPALINQATGGFTRVRWQPSNPIDPAGFGTTGDAKVGIMNVGTQPYAGFASQSMSGAGSALSDLGNSEVINPITDNTFQYSDILTWQKEKHLFKFGATILRYQQNTFYPGNDGALGVFSFTGAFTSNPTITSVGTATAGTYPGTSYTPTTLNGYSYCGTCNAGGSGIADWELDRVNSDGVGSVQGGIGDRSYRQAYFAQDDWKLTPALTLNLGVRYEYVQPIYEANNKQMNVLPVAVPGGNVTAEFAGQLPAAALLPPNASATGATITDEVCPTRSCYSDPHNQISPRVGFAYQLQHNLVIRGGYGMTNYMEGTGANLRLFYNPPYLPSSILPAESPASSNGAVVPGTFYQESQGFGTGSTVTGGGAGGTYRQWQQNMKPGVIAEYDLTTEYQLNNYSSIKVAYVGESGQHLILAGAANQLAQPCYVNGVISNAPSSTTACFTSDPTPYQALVGQTGSIVGTFSTGMMNYNGLQATYRQRASKGLEFTANYTYGRSMTNSDGFFEVPGINGPSAYAENYYDNHAEYGRVGEDVRNNFNATGVYDLPFGRGRQFATHDPIWLDELIGGWKYSQTAIVYSGFPVTVNASNNDAYTLNDAQRANFNSKPKITGRTLNNWFGTDPSITQIANCTTVSPTAANNGVCAFGEPAEGTYGTSKVGTLSAPGYRQFDLSLFKDFTVYKQQKLGFRANMYNFSNTSSWSNPNNTIGSSFGAITGVRSPQRQLELALKYTY